MEFVYLNHCLYVQFNVPYSGEMKNTCQNGQKESEKICTRSSILKKVQIIYKYVVTFNLDPKKEGREILRSRYLPLQKCLRIGDMEIRKCTEKIHGSLFVLASFPRTQVQSLVRCLFYFSEDVSVSLQRCTVSIQKKRTSNWYLV